MKRRATERHTGKKRPESWKKNKGGTQTNLKQEARAFDYCWGQTARNRAISVEKERDTREPRKLHSARTPGTIAKDSKKKGETGVMWGGKKKASDSLREARGREGQTKHHPDLAMIWKGEARLSPVLGGTMRWEP